MVVQSLDEIIKAEQLSWTLPHEERASEGGEGSGNFGHEGRPGAQGGSSSGGYSEATPADKDWKDSLTPEELHSVERYAGTTSTNLNSKLRSGDSLTDKEKAEVALLDSAISKAPKLEKATIFYRRQPTDTAVTNKGYTSAMRSVEGIGKHYMGRGQELHAFWAPAGTPVASPSYASGSPYNEEVLFGRDTEFFDDTVLGEGGPGSGNWGHQSTDGQWGGSEPGTGGNRPTGKFSDEERAAFKNVYGGKWPIEAKTINNWRDTYNTVGASQIKDAVVTQIAADTGIPYDQVNDTVATWARTSNDTHPLSLELQKAGADFKGTELSEWQQKNEARLALTREYADRYHQANMEADRLSTMDDDAAFDKAVVEQENARNLFNLVSSAQLGNASWDNPDVFRDVDFRAQEYGKDMDRFVETTYNQTQAYLKNEGYAPDDEITIYRGVKVTDPISAGDAQWIGNALESWSLSPDVAQGFGDVWLAARVPVSSVFSTAMTGPGCLSELEVIIFGGPMPVYVVRGNQ